MILVRQYAALKGRTLLLSVSHKIHFRIRLLTCMCGQEKSIHQSSYCKQILSYFFSHPHHCHFSRFSYHFCLILCQNFQEVTYVWFCLCYFTSSASCYHLFSISQHPDHQMNRKLSCILLILNRIIWLYHDYDTQIQSQFLSHYLSHKNQYLKSQDLLW